MKDPVEKQAVSSAKEVVLSLVQALNAMDYETARKYLSDAMKFEGVLGVRDGAEAYMKDMEKMKLHYDVKKVFADGDDVCLFYELWISGVNLFGCGWYHVEKEKVTSLKVIFDPRPILNKK